MTVNCACVAVALGVLVALQFAQSRHNWICGICCHSTLVIVVAGHKNITPLAPCGPPPVTHKVSECWRLHPVSGVLHHLHHNAAVNPHCDIPNLPLTHDFRTSQYSVPFPAPRAGSAVSMEWERSVALDSHGVEKQNPRPPPGGTHQWHPVSAGTGLASDRVEYTGGTNLLCA